MKKTTVPRRLYRRQTTCEILDCSLSLVKQLENDGVLTKIVLRNRDVRHLASEVDTLAAGGEIDGENG